MSFYLSVIIENIKFFAKNVLRTFGNMFNSNIIISSIITLIMLFFIFKNRKIIISYGKKINILNIIKSIFRFIHKYYIMSFIILFILSAVAFSLIYFGHSKKIENRFDNALKNYEETMKNIITNIVIINETNKYISTNSFQRNIDNTVNNKIVINNNSQNDTAEYLKMSFEVSFDILKNSITIIMKDSNDILQFWFAFLSIIMIVFTLTNNFINNSIFKQAKENLNDLQNKYKYFIKNINKKNNRALKLIKDIEKEAKNSIDKIKTEAKEETRKLIEENNKNIQENELFNFGMQAVNSKDYQSVIYYFTEIINLNPKNLRAYNNRGNAKNDLANTKEKNSEEYNKLVNEAIEDYNKAIELNSNYSIAYYNRGNAKIKLQKVKEAIKDFIKAYNLDNDNEIKEKSKNQLISLAKQGYEKAIKFCEEHNINYKDSKE